MSVTPRWMWGDEGEHDHQWGAVEIAPATGNPHRKCQVLGCRFITLDLHDETYCRHCGEAIYEDGDSNWTHESDSHRSCDRDDEENDPSRIAEPEKEVTA